MLYAWLADLVLALHFAFVVFAAAGGLLVLRWRPVAFVHVPAAAWAAFVEITDRMCPLTPLENTLRWAAGRPPYTGDFIAHYADAIIYPADLTRGVQIALAALLIAFNIAVYAAVWRRKR